MSSARRALPLASLLLVATCGLALPTARAGDRELSIVVVMAEAVEDPDAGRCFRQIRSTIADDYTLVSMLGSRRLLRLLGEESIEGFMDWDAARFAPVIRDRSNPEHLRDAIAIIDCRPGERRVDILVVHPSGAPIPSLGESGDDAAQLRLRRMTIDRARTRWLGELILRYAWIGFVP